MTARSYPEDVELADGRAIRVRPIAAGDAEALRTGFAHLSDEARYRRFLTPTEHLTEQQIAYFVDVDHHDHEALVALRADTGEGVAVARYIRSPDARDHAEIAAVVLDDWQGAGIGTLLCERLAERARAEGIRYASGLMLAGNDEMLGILRRLGPEVSRERGTGALDVVVDLSPGG
ncbi:MAG: GNAT family N-acetyltransferase [Solirubrobacteraceae bacterium]